MSGIVRRAALACSIALVVMAAAPPLPEAAANPALARIARRNRAAAEALVAEARAALAAPAPTQSRSSVMLSPADRTLLGENPLFRALFAHDPGAALGLLERVKAAGGRK